MILSRLFRAWDWLTRWNSRRWRKANKVMFLSDKPTHDPRTDTYNDWRKPT